ncbi:MAG TPA: hypothetical protein VL625_07445 [Patescibacteria group bacterium]|nr:hypothetical protein [Patescibacteria group bacterium]
MPKVTGLTEEEMQKLNDVIEPLLHKGMAEFEAHVNNKAERVAFNIVEMAIKTAEHFPLSRRLGTLIDGSNKLLPKLTRYFNDQAIAEFVPPELKTTEIADLCEKAGAKPLADLLRKAATPAPGAVASSTPVANTGASAAVQSTVTTPGVSSTGPVLPKVDLRIAPTPKIPPGPGQK